MSLNTLAKHFNEFSQVAYEIPFYRVFLTKKEKTFKNLLTFVFCCDIILKRDFEFARKIDGGLAQLARASGSYPAGRWFKSDIRYHPRPVGQAVKTRPFHGCNMGSIPVRVTKPEKSTLTRVLFFILSGLATRTLIESSAHTNQRCPHQLSSHLITSAPRTTASARLGSHLPLGDRQACLPGAERANIRQRRNPRLKLTYYITNIKTAPSI